MALKPPTSVTPAISADRAAELAVAFVRHHTSYKDLGSNLHGERLSEYDKEHGDVIDFHTLRAGPRVYLPETPYEPVTDSQQQESRWLYEPHFIVPLYSSRGVETMIVAVPVRDLGYTIDGQGRIHPAGGTGSIRLTTIVVSAGAEYDMPLSAECAMLVTGEASGRRVTRPPQAVSPGRPWHPSVLFWKLTLDEPFEVVVSGVEARDRLNNVQMDTGAMRDTVRVVYVGLEPRNRGDRSSVWPVWFRAWPVQPAAETLVVPRIDSGTRLTQRPRTRDGAELKPLPADTLILRVRAGFATRFERVRLPHAPRMPQPRHRPCMIPGSNRP